MPSSSSSLQRPKEHPSTHTQPFPPRPAAVVVPAAFEVGSRAALPRRAPAQRPSGGCWAARGLTEDDVVEPPRGEEAADSSAAGRSLVILATAASTLLLAF
eukprot:3665133-Prymnesium_polylepis.1